MHILHGFVVYYSYPDLLVIHIYLPFFSVANRCTHWLNKVNVLHLQGLGSQMAGGFDGKSGPQGMLSGSRVRGCQQNMNYAFKADRPERRLRCHLSFKICSDFELEKLSSLACSCSWERKRWLYINALAAQHFFNQGSKKAYKSSWIVNCQIKHLTQTISKLLLMWVLFRFRLLWQIIHKLHHITLQKTCASTLTLVTMM